MKIFNITAQVYKNNDVSKQNLLINQVMDGIDAEEALERFRLNFPSIEFSVVKILSIEQIPQVAT